MAGGLTFVKIVLLYLFFAGSVTAQTHTVISPLVGYHVFHSDNRLPITRSNNWGQFTGLAVVRSYDLRNFHLLCKLSAERSRIHAAIQEPVTDQLGNPLGQRSVSMTQLTFPVDLSVVWGSRLRVGLGVTIAWSSHEIDAGPKDRIVSAGAGANAVVMLIRTDAFGPNLGYQVEWSNRYVKSYHVRGAGRDLSGYHLDFLTTQVSVGLVF